MQITVRLFLLLILFVISSNTVFAQNSATLRVEIVDRNLNVILQGQIRLSDENARRVVSKTLNGKSFVKFEGLAIGELSIEIVSPGFETFRKGVMIKEGLNSLTLKLRIGNIKENVMIDPSDTSRRLSRSFSGTMSQKEIDSLPDNPREIKKELRRRYGEDITIRINGFIGGQIPPKEAIRSIHVSRGNFDAEFHALGHPSVNIVTKAAVPNLIASVSFDFGNSALNARNAFASEKPTERNRLIYGFLTAPINKKSSFSISYSNSSSVREEIVIANVAGLATPSNELSTITSQSLSGDFNSDLGNDFTLRMNYQYVGTDISNAGVGGFNLPERGQSSGNRTNEIKISLNGTIANRFTSQFRSRFSLKAVRNKSNSEEVGIIVSDSFNAGGAGVDNFTTDNRFEVFQMISVGVGRHFVKFGGEWQYKTRDLSSSNGTNGHFFFKSIDDYLLQRPSTYTRSEGINDLSFSRSVLALFIQDDFQLFKRLQLGFGLRYELQNHLSDRNNFTPRVSAAIVLDEKARFVLRTGAGFLYDWYDSAKIQSVLSNNGSQNSQLIIINPGFPDPYRGGVIRESLGSSIVKQAKNLKNPYIFVTQTALGANFGNGLRFDYSYKFERGVNMFRSRDINAPIDGVRPNADFGRIRHLESSATFTRNSFQFTGEGVLFKRVRVNARYLLSKSVDDSNGVFGLPVDNYELSLEKGTSGLDRRHFFTTRFDYSPFRDFRINPSFTISSPLPYTITTGRDDNGDSIFNDRPLGIARNTERGEWSKTVNLRLSWAIPIFKRSATTIKNGKKESAANVPSFLKYHKLNLSVSINNLLNTNNKHGFVGNRLSPFFRRATGSSPARSVTFNFMFLYF